MRSSGGACTHTVHGVVYCGRVRNTDLYLCTSGCQSETWSSHPGVLGPGRWLMAAGPRRDEGVKYGVWLPSFVFLSLSPPNSLSLLVLVYGSVDRSLICVWWIWMHTMGTWAGTDPCCTCHSRQIAGCRGYTRAPPVCTKVTVGSMCARARVCVCVYGCIFVCSVECESATLQVGRRVSRTLSVFPNHLILGQVAA
jgi:hypothetical protein